jgi:hypothetical protein
MGDNIMTGLHVAALFTTFAFLFLLLPRVIFPLREIPGTALDRAVAGVVAMTALSVAAAYLAWAIGILETLPIAAAWIATWWFLKGRRGQRGRLSRTAQRFFTFWDLSEAKGPGEAAREMREVSNGGRPGRLRRWATDARERATDVGVMLPSLAVMGALALGAWFRFERPWTHVELVPQDSYLALYWTKSISAGQLLDEGIYPQGAYIWMSLLDRFYPFDTYTLTRFAGPLMSLLGLVALYWAVSRITRSRAAGAMSVVLFGAFAGHPALLVEWSRQIG